MTLPLALYRAATGLLEPLAPAVLRSRAGQGKEAPARLGERLGRATAARPDAPLIWLHGVSVGESLSLLPLVESFRRHFPKSALLVTSGTVTAAEVLARRLPDGVIHQYAPIDTPRAVARFLDHWRPDAGLLVESELWPNLIGQAKTRGVRLFLLSARMTDASAAGWARAPASARSLLSAFDLVMAQDAATEERLRRLGATLGPRLNLKLVGAPPAVDRRAAAALRKRIGGRRVVLAVSTHAGEEPIVARAFREAVSGGPPALLIVAVRHPERGAAVAAELASAGFTVARRSAGEAPGADTTAYVADTLGELGLFLSVADIAVMGGSFLPGIGGHNPMEPAQLGVPVVTGPHHFNAAEVYAEMFARVAAVEAADASALARHLRGLLTYPHIARRIGEAGLDFAQAQSEALGRALHLITPRLTP
jgi:3-deoxy-D-manno-octulosonic-acid transferase